MKQQSGFTLIELIAVIVILGVLAATALPKFLDLSEAARVSAVQGVAGGLASGAALNHANTIAKKAGLTSGTVPQSIANCTEVGSKLLEGGLPPKYVIVAQTIAANATVNCEVFLDDVTVNGTKDTTEKSSTFAAFGDVPPT